MRSLVQKTRVRTDQELGVSLLFLQVDTWLKKEQTKYEVTLVNINHYS